mgnify:CR=1 FL=1
MVDDTAVYLAACQGRISSLLDVSDIIHVIAADDIRGHVISRLVSQCVELYNQTSGGVMVDCEMKKHWADVTVSLINNHHSLIGMYDDSVP